MDKSKTNSPRKQKQLGPAPIASFEDTSSDELKFKMDLNKADSHLTDIAEQDSPNKKVKSNESAVASTHTATKPEHAPQLRNVLRVSQTPRIDISRASSSSQQGDSRDSSPENVFDQVGTGTLQEGNESSDLGFGEDGTNDLRRSTEELYYTEDEKPKEKAGSDWQQQTSPVLFKFDERQQACLQQNARKDSVSSEVAALLCISGRTSRISSVGSQGSAVSRLSAVSGVSGVSGKSRSPSPHKMLLETSFCGPKPLNSGVAGAAVITGDTTSVTDELEQIILARKHDLTKAVLAEGINIDLSTPKKTAPKKPTPAAATAAAAAAAAEANGNVKDVLPEKTVKRTQILTDKNAASLARNNSNNKSQPIKKGGVLKKNNCTIVGVTPSGTQYIRIKLKPDELYDDKGLSSNERVIEEAEISKPDTLSLKKSTTKKAPPHFSQLVQSESSSKQSAQQQQQDHRHLTPSASPKPSRSAVKNAGSRSPSPATQANAGAAAASAGVSISRKSSFCSLFKSKEAASPDSPSGQRKKSAISILLDSPRDRSRSKSRESEKSGCSSGGGGVGGGGGLSANTTPSKQRSVLAIFKPRRNSSKSSSPIDPEMHEIMSKQSEHNSRKQKASSEEPSFQQRPGSTTPRLRYYDQPKDSTGIYIPLHTPPEEKENVTFAGTIAPSQSKIAAAAAAAALARNTTSTQQRQQANVDMIEPAPITKATAAKTSTVASSVLPKSGSSTTTNTKSPKAPPVNERRAKQPITKCVVSTTTKPRAQTQSPKINDSYRIELPDGSIRIPLKPPDEHVDSTIDDIDNNSQWSTAAQPSSSQDSQDTVCSSKAVSLVSGAEVAPSKIKSSVITTMATVQTPPITAEADATIDNSNVTAATAAAAAAVLAELKLKMPAKQVSQDETTVVTIENANGGIRAMSKERKRILFSTKIGSGSEEQIFATQLSLSKTESLSSQLSSEQGTNLESPSAEKTENIPRDEQKTQQSQSRSQSESVVVRMRQKDEKEIEAHKEMKQDVINVNRHSMYIENVDEVMETQRRLESERKNSLLTHAIAQAAAAAAAERIKSADSSGGHSKQKSAKPVKPERCSKSQSPKSREKDEERRIETVASTTAATSAGGGGGGGGAGSSGSEHDSEMDSKHRNMARQIGAVEEESAGLMSQDSYEDTLPYIPTTLPEERAMGICIKPVRERARMEVKTCPVERPRSTTPLNISCLQEYCGAGALTEDLDISITRGEKLRISLPRRDVRDGQSGGSSGGGSGSGSGSGGAVRSKSPRRASNTSWFDFAEQGIGGVGMVHSPSNATADESSSMATMTTTTTTTTTAQRRKSHKTTTEWIDFENIPEKRKPAKRITTLPHKDGESGMHHVQYNYVNPEECQCECHERDGGSNNTDSDRKESLTVDQSPDDCVPLLESDPEENLNRNQATNEQLDRTIHSSTATAADSWLQESFGSESQDGNKIRKSSFDSGGSQSPIYTRSNKTTTVQLPQRLQR